MVQAAAAGSRRALQMFLALQGSAATVGRWTDQVLLAPLCAPR